MRSFYLVMKLSVFSCKDVNAAARTPTCVMICPKVFQALAVASTGNMSTPVPRYCVLLPSFYKRSLQLVLPNVDLHSREKKALKAESMTIAAPELVWCSDAYNNRKDR